MPVQNWSRLFAFTQSSGGVLRVAKCGNCGIVFGQQLSFGLSDDEVEDEEYEDGFIEVE